jgi:hypothetical protein
MKEEAEMGQQRSITRKYWTRKDIMQEAIPLCDIECSGMCACMSRGTVLFNLSTSAFCDSGDSAPYIAFNV